MEYTDQLPTVIGRFQLGLDRLTRPPRLCRESLIGQPGGVAMWKFLRKHLNVEDTEFILRALQEQEKQTWRDEALRREYLRLYDECKHFDPQWGHTEKAETAGGQ